MASSDQARRKGGKYTIASPRHIPGYFLYLYIRGSRCNLLDQSRGNTFGSVGVDCLGLKEMEVLIDTINQLISFCEFPYLIVKLSIKYQLPFLAINIYWLDTIHLYLRLIVLIE